MTHRGPFQHLLFCDSVTTSLFHNKCSSSQGLAEGYLSLITKVLPELELSFLLIFAEGRLLVLCLAKFLLCRLEAFLLALQCIIYYVKLLLLLLNTYLAFTLNINNALKKCVSVCFDETAFLLHF